MDEHDSGLFVGYTLHNTSENCMEEVMQTLQMMTCLITQAEEKNKQAWYFSLYLVLLNKSFDTKPLQDISRLMSMITEYIFTINLKYGKALWFLCCYYN